MTLIAQRKGELKTACWLQLLAKIKLFYIHTTQIDIAVSVVKSSAL